MLSVELRFDLCSYLFGVQRRASSCRLVLMLARLVWCLCILVIVMDVNVRCVCSHRLYVRALLFVFVALRYTDETHSAAMSVQTHSVICPCDVDAPPGRTGAC